MNAGAPNSPARWLSENIETIPADHKYALIEVYEGSPRLLKSGTKEDCKRELHDHTKQVVCELSKYRKKEPANRR